LGIFAEAEQQRLQGTDQPYWLHAVSVGEVGVARKLIKEILKREPTRRIVLSTTTSTGHAVATKDAPHQLTVIYSPLDFLWIVRRVLRLVNPEILIFVEAEVWPNLTCLAKRRGVRLALANARLSPRSGRRYAKFRWFVEPIFSLLDVVMVQFPEGVERWRQIGAREESIVLTGSVKYDEPTAKVGRSAEFRELLLGLWGPSWGPVLLGASTFPGEEKMLAEVMQNLRDEFPQLKLILVPRHVERSAEILGEMEPLGLRAVRRSQLPTDQVADVLLVDTTGELRDWQQLPQVVVIGKSFLAKGGQNPVEAIAAGTPVITGPSMENFALVMKLLLDAGAVVQLAEASALTEAVRQLLLNPESARAATEGGRKALEGHHGATRKSVDCLTALRKET
jgi:3-deoxy-D-manno-octulosonic-acid transferase